MCDEQKMKTVVEDILFNPNENGETIIGREVNNHLDEKAKDIVYNLTLRFAIPFVGLVVAGAGVWYTLQADVARHEKLLGDEARWSQQQQEVYARNVEAQITQQTMEITQLRTDYADLAKELRTDIKTILNLLYTR